jgi:hypothetical protein
MTMKIAKSHRELLKLLQEKEVNGEHITKREILRRTGWKDISFRTYWTKGQLSDFLNEIGDAHYEASNTIGLTEQEFTKILSQSKHRRGLGHHCKSRLAKALLRKSKDNMLLALELYNRPSLENRMDSFVLCFCIAWEQLLKAILIEKQGEDSIFRDGTNRRGHRETISLRDCLERLFRSDSIVRKNIERIAYYRDQAVHLLMPEVQGILSRVFQSGVLNYSTQFHEFTEQHFLPASHSGMLSLVGDLRQPSIVSLKTNYGRKVGEEIFELVNTITQEAQEIDDIQFAIPLNVRLVFAKYDSEGNVVTLARAEEGMEALKDAIVVEKPVDHSKTHPFTEKKCIVEINQRLKQKHPKEFLLGRLVARNRSTQEPEINSYCFRAIVDKLKWKNSDNRYHFKDKTLGYHSYSDFAIEELITHIVENSDFVKTARESYAHKLRKKKRRA